MIREHPLPATLLLAIGTPLIMILCDAVDGRTGSWGAPVTTSGAGMAPTARPGMARPGIAGLLLEVREGRLLIAAIEPGSAAAAAGILPGDRILILNDVNLIDLDPLSPADALDRIAASPSPEIRLVLGRGAGTLGVVLPRETTPTTRPAKGPPDVGAEAPIFTATDLEGVEIRLDALRGRPVLVDFWASWCPPCRGAALTLRRIAGEHGERLAIVGVSLDDDRRSFEAFSYNNHMPGNQIFDGGWKGPIATLYGISSVGIPYAVLVGEDGRVAARSSALTDLEDEIARRAAAADASLRGTQ